MAHPGRKLITRRSFLFKALCAAGVTLLTGSGLGWYGAEVEPRRVDIVRQRVVLPRLPDSFVGTTIAQISDLHLGPFVGREYLRQVITLLLELKPDLIAITGDHVTSLRSGEADILSEELSRLSAPLGVFSVLGNHDRWTNSEVVARSVRNAGITLLQNQSVSIEQNEQRFFVVGLDDVWGRPGKLSLALSDIPSGACTVLLVHEPDFADEATRDPRISLQLSGHSHGGQVRLPGIGPIYLPAFGRKYPQGLRKVGEMFVYTNRGIGVTSPPIRLNCPPEITLFQLVAA